MTKWTEEQRAQAVRNWIADVSELVNQAAGWAREENWSVDLFEREHQERALGAYTLPHLKVVTPFGEVHVEPVARDVLNADGRVDVRSWPFLNRVKLIRRAGAWEIITDSNVPLGIPWSKAAFMRLARELQAAA